LQRTPGLTGINAPAPPDAYHWLKCLGSKGGVMYCHLTHRADSWRHRLSRAPQWRTSFRIVAGLLALAGTLLAPVHLLAAQTDILGPPGSVAFGTAVYVLPNGNLVVTDPAAPAASQGAVYLFSPAGTLLSTLTGGHPNDALGSGGVTVLTNGNYVINSPSWNGGAGAVTWGDADAGVSGVVSSVNSLLGAGPGDEVGAGGVTALSNGNYVVSSPFWTGDGGATSKVGAVTWGDGSSGTVGAVSAANSLLGTSDDDQLGIGGTVPLANGYYLIISYAWDNGGTTDVGAVTQADGAGALTGAVSAANSLVGTNVDDQVGLGGVTVLSNGNYLVVSYAWDGPGGGTPITDVGAVTWVDGGSGLAGVVSVANSLVGSSNDDRVGISGVTALANGHYVVLSERWNNGLAESAGAATWGNGATGATGVVSPANSLTGSAINDLVGAGGAVALANGNYVVLSPSWFNPSTEVATAGAVTWGNGSAGIAAAVSAGNSLVGLATDDRVGYGGVAALADGNYVVVSPFWDNGIIADAGAVTRGDGAGGSVGAVSVANSLIGTTTADQVGGGGVTALTNGHYVACSPLWDNGATANAGAVTWLDGSVATSGALSPANSLIGSQPFDTVGIGGASALGNGNYVVRSYNWANGGAADAGAVTWLSGAEPFTGVVSASNSLVGSAAGDLAGYAMVAALSDGNYVVHSPFWDNGGTLDAGAVTPADGSFGASGPILAQNSVLGTVAAAGNSMVFGYDAARRRVAVGRPASNRVTLITVPTQLIFADGFE
jgi:YD repeat-containing protein